MSERGPISRRLFLGGAGAAVALPMLESLLPRAARAAALPRRLLFYYVPNGIHMQSWTPAATGAGYALTPILSPLKDHKDDVLVLSGLANRPAKPPDGPGDHAGGTGAFLTCTRVRRSETDIQAAVSADQLAARQIGKDSRFPSLQLGIEGGTSAGGCDSGFSCAYTRNISWAGPATPLQKSVNPQVVFDLLFAGSDLGQTQQEIDRRRRYKKSVLDYVRTDAQRLRGRLGTTDQRKIDEYLQGVREVETSLDGMGLSCQPGARPAADPPFPDQVKVMTDLMVLALQCDLSRVVTFMFGNAASGRAYPFLGITGGHHEISHHMGLPDNYAKLEKIDTYEVSQLAYLLQRMKQVKEGAGTLLDNTAVFFSSEIADGNAHGHTNLPVLLAGKLGGALRPGRHVAYPDGTPMANLFISLLGAVGARVSTFGDDGTGPLSDLG